MTHSGVPQSSSSRAEIDFNSYEDLILEEYMDMTYGKVKKEKLSGAVHPCHFVSDDPEDQRISETRDLKGALSSSDGQYLGGMHDSMLDQQIVQNCRSDFENKTAVQSIHDFANLNERGFSLAENTGTVSVKVENKIPNTSGYTPNPASEYSSLSTPQMAENQSGYEGGSDESSDISNVWYMTPNQVDSPRTGWWNQGNAGKRSESECYSLSDSYSSSVANTSASQVSYEAQQKNPFSMQKMGQCEADISSKDTKSDKLVIDWSGEDSGRPSVIVGNTNESGTARNLISAEPKNPEDYLPSVKVNENITSQQEGGPWTFEKKHTIGGFHQDNATPVCDTRYHHWSGDDSGSFLTNYNKPLEYIEDDVDQDFHEDTDNRQVDNRNLKETQIASQIKPHGFQPDQNLQPFQFVDRQPSLLKVRPESQVVAPESSWQSDRQVWPQTANILTIPNQPAGQALFHQKPNSPPTVPERAERQNCSMTSNTTAFEALASIGVFPHPCDDSDCPGDISRRFQDFPFPRRKSVYRTPPGPRNSTETVQPSSKPLEGLIQEMFEMEPNQDEQRLLLRRMRNREAAKRCRKKKKEELISLLFKRAMLLIEYHRCYHLRYPFSRIVEQ